MWVNELARFLFPYRAHLEDEIEFLKAQLAQRQRRVDELQEKLLDIPRQVPKTVQYRREENGKLTPVQPRGWDEVRAFRRANPEKEEADAVQSQ